MAAPGGEPKGLKTEAPILVPGGAGGPPGLLGGRGAPHDTHSRRRNADIFNHMAQVLAHQGHPARTLEQVRGKVKELCLSYVRASEGQGAGANTCPQHQRLHRILGQGPSVPVDTCLRPPVTRTREAGEEEDTASGLEDEASTITHQAEAPSGSPDVSCASLEAGEGSTQPGAPSQVHGGERERVRHSRLRELHAV